MGGAEGREAELQEVGHQEPLHSPSPPPAWVGREEGEEKGVAFMVVERAKGPGLTCIRKQAGRLWSKLGRPGIGSKRPKAGGHVSVKNDHGGESQTQRTGKGQA